MKNSHVADFIDSLINEINSALKCYPNGYVRRIPGIKQLGIIEDSLKKNEVEPGHTDIWNNAWKWVNDVKPTLSTPEEIFYHFYTLLDKLDQHVMDDRPTWIERDYGYLVLGWRWWWYLARNTEGGKPSNRTPLLDSRRMFPHIRKIEMTPEEKHTSLGLNRSFYKSIGEDKALKILLCTFDGQSKTHFEPTVVTNNRPPTHGFQAKYVKRKPETEGQNENEAYLSEVRRAMEHAREIGAVILIMPELTVCDAGRKLIRQELLNHPGKPCLVVGGSFHVKNNAGQTVNAAPIFFRRIDKSVPGLSFEKTQAFSIPTKRLTAFDHCRKLAQIAEEAECDTVMEDIVIKEKALIISTILGDFGILICKDFLVDHDPAIRKTIHSADHLLIPSMNPAEAWFKENARKAVRDFGTATFYVNAAQAVQEGDCTIEIAIWALPCRLNGKPLDEVIFYRRQPGDTEEIKRTLPDSGNILFECQLPEAIIARAFDEI